MLLSVVSKLPSSEELEEFASEVSDQPEAGDGDGDGAAGAGAGQAGEGGEGGGANMAGTHAPPTPRFKTPVRGASFARTRGGPADEGNAAVDSGAGMETPPRSGAPAPSLAMRFLSPITDAFKRSRSRHSSMR